MPVCITCDCEFTGGEYAKYCPECKQKQKELKQKDKPKRKEALIKSGYYPCPECGTVRWCRTRITRCVVCARKKGFTYGIL